MKSDIRSIQLSVTILDDGYRSHSAEIAVPLGASAETQIEAMQGAVKALYGGARHAWDIAYRKELAELEKAQEKESAPTNEVPF